MTKKPRVTVTQETESGRNKKFIDNKTRKEMTRAQFVARIESGEYVDYYVRNQNGIKTPASKPNGKIKDNLG